MSKGLVKSDDGWTMVGDNGHPIGTYQELSFFVDLRYESALFPGTFDGVKGIVDKFSRMVNERGSKEEKKELPKRIVIATLGDNIDETEAFFMLETFKLPRRVAMRLKA